MQIFCAYTSPSDPSEHGKVLRKHTYFATHDLAVAGNYPVPERPVLLQPEVVRAVDPVTVQLDERSLVQQQVYPLARGEFAPFPLAFDCLLRGGMGGIIPQLV